MIHSLEDIRSALEKRLARAPSVRQMIGRREFFIQDPLTSHIQRGDRKFHFDYRNGLLIDMDSKAIYFSIIHCPAISRHFKANFDFDSLVTVLDRTKKWRTEHLLAWSSTHQQMDIWISEVNYREFRGRLMEANNALDLKKDLFFGLDRRKHPNPKGRRGNLFSVLLGRFDRIQSAQSLVEAAMPLLGWCLPGDEHPGRLASLAAVLVAADVRKICEHQQIINAPAEFYSMECSSRIEGAHIKPHVRGGSASLSNGLWLCKSHHVASEGRIYGIRTKCRWNSKTAQKTAIKKGKGCDSLGIQAITPVEIFNSNPPLIYGHALHRHS